MSTTPRRVSWFDEKNEVPLIEQRARQLESFVQAMRDGIVEESELKAQEARLVSLMKEIEPKLDDALHEKVTELLCELTAYDLMQTFYAIQEARPKSRFQG
ncbi:MAG: hypothetical protein NZM31_05275 [Gemmatales bacterium]|nr:hypothetical protein [Gemmatales bacterium]MDW8386409.1 hypothetical protein [Gemmatales bacterium]